MPTYTLNLTLSPEQLKNFYPDSNIIIAKPTKGESPNVAWQTFHPFEHNSVTWEEQYGIYVSSASVEHGAQLTRMSMSHFPAMEQKLYTLGEDAVFGDPPEASEGVAGSFYAENNYEEQRPLTFGLFQDAVVNGKQIPGNAISAASVPHKNKATMTPHTTVFIWVESNVASNTVVTEVNSHQTEAVFGEGKFDISLAYDDASGNFI